MRMCPRCRSEFAEGELEVCPFDNWGLVTPEDYYEAEGDPLLGALLGGRFRIVGRLGVGAMGTVYKAVQASVDRMVALKVLRPDLTKDPDTAARFHREAHATSALKHPSTVTLYDFGQTAEGYLYIAMELLEGRLLGRVLKEEGALPVDVAVRIVIQIARSLAEAHRKGIVHRDLKPDNIMLAQVEGQEVVKVLDFGIAKVVRGDRRVDALETQAGTVFGTPRYMSPEQAQSKPLDARSDLYSLGVIFYQMLTGHAPYEDADAVVVMARHIKTRPRKPSEVRPDLKIPPRIEKIVLRLMEKDRTKRPQSAEELIEALNHFLQTSDEDFTLASLSGGGESRRWLLPVAITAGVAVILLGGVVIAFSMSRGGGGGAETPRADAGGQTAAILPTQGSAEPPAEPDMAFDEPDAPDVLMVSLRFDSRPSGAKVMRDGEEIGHTPLTLEAPEGDELELEFLLAGFHPKVASLTVSPDEPEHLVKLVPRRPIKAASSNHRGPTKRRDPSAGAKSGAPTKTPEPPRKRPGSRYGRFDER